MDSSCWLTSVLRVALLAAWPFLQHSFQLSQSPGHQETQNPGLSSLALASNCQATPRTVSSLERIRNMRVKRRRGRRDNRETPPHTLCSVASFPYAHTCTYTDTHTPPPSGGRTGLGGQGRLPGMQFNIPRLRCKHQ